MIGPGTTRPGSLPLTHALADIDGCGGRSARTCRSLAPWRLPDDVPNPNHFESMGRLRNSEPRMIPETWVAKWLCQICCEESSLEERNMPCPICGGKREQTHEALLLQRHMVSYWKCRECEFWGTEEATWLDEAYSDAIGAADTGLVGRNLNLARRMPLLLARMARGRSPVFVDWAGGYGLFVRLMRDRGFDFYWQDDYATNILAQPYLFQKTDSASVVTAIEVLEHVQEPIAFIRRILSETKCETIIFTTQLHDSSYDPHWWYLAPEGGQHISFYSPRTLDKIAEAVGMNVRSCGGLHMLTSRNISQFEYAFIVKVIPRIPLSNRWLGSLTQSDHEAAVARMRAGN